MNTLNPCSGAFGTYILVFFIEKIIYFISNQAITNEILIK